MNIRVLKEERQSYRRMREHQKRTAGTTRHAQRRYERYQDKSLRAMMRWHVCASSLWGFRSWAARRGYRPAWIRGKSGVELLRAMFPET